MTSAWRGCHSATRVPVLVGRAVVDDDHLPVEAERFDPVEHVDDRRVACSLNAGTRKETRTLEAAQATAIPTPAAASTAARLTAPSSLVPRLIRMKAPKILAVASAVDLDFRYGCTPAWWQLWKGLYEVGVDLIVTPYRGRPVESPWWRTAPNPTSRRGRELRRRARRARAAEGRPLPPPRGGPARRDGVRQGDARDDLALGDAALAAPPDEGARAGARRRRGRRLHRADGALPRHPDLPARALRRAGRLLRRRRADEPARVRRHGHGLQLLPRRRPVRVRPRRLELGGRLERLRELGARRAEAVFWGADPEFFARRRVEKVHDVFFYGYGDKFRRDWMAAMVGEPSRAAPSSSSRSAAATSRATPAAPG